MHTSLTNLICKAVKEAHTRNRLTSGGTDQGCEMNGIKNQMRAIDIRHAIDRILSTPPLSSLSCCAISRGGVSAKKLSNDESGESLFLYPI